MARFDLPVFAGVLLLCAAVAIILSTANAFLMVTSTDVTRDVYQRFVNPGVSPAGIVRFQRICIVVLGVLAFVVANFFDTILAMALSAYTMVGAGLTPALMAAFLWRRVTVAGGMASIVCGMGVTLAITVANVFRDEPVVDSGFIIIPASAASILALVAVSLVTSPSPEAKWRPFLR
jgi:SSS family solute:Na+ symporter/sodium/proline symporter